MISLCIASSVKSGPAQKRKVTPDVINAMTFPVSILKMFGTEKWIQDEEARYICPECGNKVFRGVVKCNQCKVKLDLD
jgi:predicted RNA-binding Zn-ribbon protein involved in translation (DUF1610 family)